MSIELNIAYRWRHIQGHAVPSWCLQWSRCSGGEQPRRHGSTRYQALLLAGTWPPPSGPRQPPVLPRRRAPAGRPRRTATKTTSSGSRSSAPGGGGDGGGGCRRGDSLMTSSWGVPRAPAVVERQASLAGSAEAEPEWSRGMDGVLGYQTSIC